MESYAAYTATSADNSNGVGVLFGDYDNQAYAVDIISGSPAQLAGVQVGDFVVAVDGQRKDEGWTLAEAIKAIDREDGSTVVVTWRRPDNLQSSGGEEFTTTLVCSKTKSQNVTSSLENNQVGYVKVRQLGSNTSEIVSDQIKELSGQGARAYVLDLRDCPGGYLTEAVNLVSLFQASGVVVQVKTTEGVSPRSTTEAAITTAPLSVIVNENTAAAAEVVAASLQDSSRAVVVGQATMGKGTVQIMRELSFGGAISYTAAEYLTPSGRSLDKNGVNPDITAAADGSSDSQLELAIESASARIEN